MLLALLSSLLLGAQVNAPPLSPEQLRELIRAKSAPLKSLVFVYDGYDRWIGDPKLANGDIRDYERTFQGTFLYRGDRAAMCDVYVTSFAQGGVVRGKSALLQNKIQAATDLMDFKKKLGPRDIRTHSGFLTLLKIYDAPLDLLPIWGLEDLIDNLHHEISIEGWEIVAERNCLRVRTCTFTNDKDQDRERDKRFYWLDLDRNAQVLKQESFRYGNLESRIDDVKLVEQSLGDKTTYWIPVSCRLQAFNLSGARDRYSKEPVSERTLAMVDGSMQINLNLPDSLFAVDRNSAYPTPRELAGIESRVNNGPLARKFQEQQPEPAYQTDPISVRKRIEVGLAEANRQSKELEASSPARQTWSVDFVTQLTIGVLGLALLGFIAFKKLRGE